MNSGTSPDGIQFDIRVNSDEDGRSVRSIVQQHLHLSRRIQRQLVVQNGISRDGETVYLTARAYEGDIISVMLPSEHTELEQEAIPLDVRYEDEMILIVNKRAGVLTHPTARERTGSLLAAAYAHIDPLVPHCVHRLDRETSGLVMLAKHGHFHHLFDAALQRGDIHRSYVALIHLSDDDVTEDWETIDLPIAQDPSSPSRRVISSTGQRAITHYKIVEARNGVGFVLIVLETGRTHQIRLHFSAIGMPLLGDPVYGRTVKRSPAGSHTEVDGAAPPTADSSHGTALSRQALHALGMWFVHPSTRKEHRIYAELPSDIVTAWAAAGGEPTFINKRVRAEFLDMDIFANIERREELT